jgi:hypothetical protein
LKKKECGVTFVEQNAGKIFGGLVAVPHSWPAAVFIVFSYAKDITIGTDKITEEFGFS